TLKLRERDPISQCFRCNRFGHKSMHCRYQVDGKPANRCVRCGDHHQGLENCQETPKCSNCVDYNVVAEKRKWKLVDTNHTARDKSCPCRSTAITKAKQQNIDYGF